MVGLAFSSSNCIYLILQLGQWNNDIQVTGQTEKENCTATHLKEEREFFQSMAKKHNTVFLDYSVNYPLCNDTTKFVSSVHMNPIGAHLFSVDFADTLNTILHRPEKK